MTTSFQTVPASFRNTGLRKPELQKPVWFLAVGWVLLIPFLFFAGNGTLIPETGDVAFRLTSSGGGAAHTAGVAVVALICSALMFARLPLVWAETQKAKMLLAIPLLAVASCLWSVEPSKSLVSGIVLLLITLFAYYFHGRFTTRGQFEMIIFLAAVALPLSFFLALLVPSIGSTTEGWRGTFGHKNNASVVSVYFLITALHWKASHLTQKVIKALIIPMSAVFIVMSHSRTGWGLGVLALFLSGGLWVLQKMTPKQALVTAVGGIPLFSGLGYALYYYASVLLQAVGKDPTLSQRTIIWGAVWNAIQVHPLLGYGYAAFWNGLKGPSMNIILIAGWGLSQAQSGYLDLWLQLGAIGIIVLAVLLGQSGLNAARSLHGGHHASYIRWCVVTILIALAYNVGESSMEIAHLTWFLFLVAYLGLSQGAREANQRSLNLARTDSLNVARAQGTVKPVSAVPPSSLQPTL